MRNDSTSSDVTIEGMKNLLLFGCESVVVDETVPEDVAHFRYEGKNQIDLVEIRATSEMLKKMRSIALRAMESRLKEFK